MFAADSSLHSTQSTESLASTIPVGQYLAMPDEQSEFRPEVQLPAGVRMLVDRLRQIEKREKSHGLPLYDRFQEVIKANHTDLTLQGLGSLFDIKAVYEANAYAHNKSQIKHTAKKIGTLASIFMYYAARKDSGTTEEWSFQDALDNTISKSAFVHFCKDFAIYPRMNSMGEILSTFKALDTSQQGALAYPKFAESLACLALIIYSRPVYAHTHRLPLEKVRSFIKFLQLSNDRVIRSKLSGLDDLRKYRDRVESAPNSRPSSGLTRPLSNDTANRIKTDASPEVVAELRKFDFVSQPENWLSFAGPWLDLGIINVSRDDQYGFVYKFKLMITNTSTQLLKIGLRTEGLDSFLDYEYSNKPLAPGMVRTAFIRFLPKARLPQGEFHGSFHISFTSIGQSNQITKDPGSMPRPKHLGCAMVPVYAKFASAMPVQQPTDPNQEPLVEELGKSVPPPTFPPRVGKLPRSGPQSAALSAARSLVAPGAPPVAVVPPVAFFKSLPKAMKSRPSSSASTRPRPRSGHLYDDDASW